MFPRDLAATNEARLRDRIDGLDGLRGISVLSVILFHAQNLLAYEARVPLIESGWIGVDVFFVLSGFLITGILRASREHPRYWRNFVIRRALRILPLYLLVLALAILPRWVLGATDGPPFWVYPAFLSNFWLAEGGTDNLILKVTWSLSIEEQFYVLWPLVVWLTSRRSLTWVCVTLVLAAPAFRFLLHSPSDQVSYMWTPCRMDSLAWGALAAVAWERRSEFWCTLAARVAPWAAIAGVGLLAVTGDIRSVKIFAVAGLSVSAAIAAGGVLAIASGRVGERSRVLEWRPLAHLGKVSYGAYLLHAPVLVLLYRAGLQGHPWLGMLAATALTWGVATVMWRRIEAPMLGLKDRLAPY